MPPSLPTPPNESRNLSLTGVSGLDDILMGGLTPGCLYLLEGDPGSGKTTLALHFLIEGARRGEPCLYVTLSESEGELLQVARSHGWSLEGIELVGLIASAEEMEPENEHTMFQPAEFELGRTTQTILAHVDRVKPRRVVIDSLSEIRLLAQNSLRYRRQVLALKNFFMGRDCTVFLIDDKTSEAGDMQLQSIAHGVISLERRAPEYGSERRRLVVGKLRGQSYRGGYHDFCIRTGGLQVFPRLVASEHSGTRERRVLVSEIAGLDALLGGGIDYGTSVLLMGPAGSGKSSMAANYARIATSRGERAAMFIFDERIETLVHRCLGLGIDLRPHLESARLTIQQVDPAELAPGEFAHAVRAAVDGTDGHGPARVIVVDSLNGYLYAMPEERSLMMYMHELLTYLGHKGVVTFLVMAQQGLVGTVQGPVDTTYLADTVIQFRYFEADGEIKLAISVVKKRTGAHERTIRELRFERGIHVGEPLRMFQGVLSGSPTYRGRADELLRSGA